VINTSAYRSNLDLRVVAVAAEADKLAQALKLVRATEGSGIVYTRTVKAAHAVHEALQGAGESWGLYHGRSWRHPSARRCRTPFMSGGTRVMVATNAFGLGIDKPDIRFGLHYQLPPRWRRITRKRAAPAATANWRAARCCSCAGQGDPAVLSCRRYPARRMPRPSCAPCAIRARMAEAWYAAGCCRRGSVRPSGQGAGRAQSCCARTGSWRSRCDGRAWGEKLQASPGQRRAPCAS
jgi:hypothetical protein